MAVADQGRARPSYRFALRPGWIASHLFVLVCVLVMVRLGFWQVARLDEVRTTNDLIAARTADAPVGIGTAVQETEASGVEGSEFRLVELRGSYLVGDEVLVRNRSFNASPGYWVLTPLRTDDGPVVTVNRGWIPVELAEGEPARYGAPTDAVVVTGHVRSPEVRQGMGVTDPTEGRLDTLSRVDVERLDTQVEAELVPFWVQLADQDPAVGDVPVVVPLPERDDGPHLNYAGQWFIFATLTAIVYPLLIRRRAHKPAERADRPEVVIDRREPLGTA